MRVIGGTLGGRRLQAPRGTVTRPTSDRVREALFSMLGELCQARVLDLFAGAGGLGIEALSRGAAQALFVERDPLALRALGHNLGALGLAPPRARVRVGDSLAALRTASRRAEAYDLVFIDPPYSRASDLGRELSMLLPPVLEPEARIVVESDRRVPLQLDIALERQRSYGQTHINIHRWR